MMDWEEYQRVTYGEPPSSNIVEFLTHQNPKTAIDLGCGCGNDTVYMAKKGINVIAIDLFLNKNYILDRLTDEEKERVSFIEGNFEEIEFPKTDVVLANYSLAFCSLNNFEKVWQKIYDALNDKGFFVGHFVSKDDIRTQKKDICSFSIEETKKHLENYYIVSFIEVIKERKDKQENSDIFSIVAQKKS